MVDQRQNQAEIDRVDEANQHLEARNAFINNTPGFFTGNDRMMCLTIQMCSMDDWNALFGGRPLNQHLQNYALDCIANAVPLEVSLLLEMNARPRIHEAIFIIYMSNHEQFYDGHIFEVEFSEGSHTHQIINQLFNTENRAVVQFMTQYDLLQFLANDDEAANLLDRFLAGFNPIEYDVANHGLSAHDCAVFFSAEENQENLGGNENDQVIIMPPVPPPPVNDFGAIFQYYYDHFEDDNQDNIIPYWLENNDRINELIQMREERHPFLIG